MSVAKEIEFPAMVPADSVIISKAEYSNLIELARIARGKVILPEDDYQHLSFEAAKSVIMEKAVRQILTMTPKQELENPSLATGSPETILMGSPTAQTDSKVANYDGLTTNFKSYDNLRTFQTNLIYRICREALNQVEHLSHH